MDADQPGVYLGRRRHYDEDDTAVSHLAWMA